MAVQNDVPAAAETNGGSLSIRLLGWSILAALAVFLLNNYLTFWRDWPGAGAGGTALAWLQLAAYPAGLGLAALYVLRSKQRALRDDAATVSSINTFVIRAAFWAVLYVGLADMVISFLRVEGLLPGIVGDALATDLGRSQFRGPVVHMPLILLAVLTAAFTRTLGFHWLALLVVAAELQIVVGRFIFSYEQAFMADLLRFWYGALFLFASAYTLLHEGHVRVDVFYTGFSARMKGLVNAAGSLVLGISLCWVILLVGMGGRASVINSPILAYETTQTGFGMYVKYLMAGFLGLFAVSMMIQFVSYLMIAFADFRGEPGRRGPGRRAVTGKTA